MGVTLDPNVVSQKAMSPTEAAYIAGLIDGEGMIGLYAKSRRKSGVQSYYAVIRISNTNLEMLKRVVEITGNGRIVQRERRQSRQKVCYDWSILVRQIRHILPQVIPFMIAKQDQAELLLEYAGLTDGHWGVPDDKHDRAEEIRSKIQALHRRGTTDEEESILLEHEQRERCDEPGCSNRRYRMQKYCYHHWMHNRVQEGVCEYCGETMRVVYAGKRFCSVKCSSLSHYHNKQKRIVEQEKERRAPGICASCGSEFSRAHYKGKRFCNDQCYARYSNAHKAVDRPSPSKEKTCVQCGVKFWTKVHDQRRMYCGDKCSTRAEYLRLRERKEKEA